MWIVNSNLIYPPKFPFGSLQKVFWRKESQIWICILFLFITWFYGSLCRSSCLNSSSKFWKLSCDKATKLAYYLVNNIILTPLGYPSTVLPNEQCTLYNLRFSSVLTRSSWDEFKLSEFCIMYWEAFEKKLSILISSE